MGGAGGRIFPTCFCDECRQYFADKKLPLSQFETFPNPWELLLKTSKTGFEYIDNVSSGETPASLVGKSALQGFGSNFKSEVDRTHAAELLMQYMIARHEMVEDFLTSVYQEARVVLSDAGKHGTGQPLKKVVLVEGVEYDWTAGMFPGRISTAVISEVWIDPTDKVPPLSSRHKMFMWRRATYFLNAFFQFLTDVGDARIRTTTGLARIPTPTVKARLRQRGAQAINNELRGVQQLAALPSLQEGQRDGFVGVVFSEELLRPLLTSAVVAPGLGDHTSGVAVGGEPRALLEALLGRLAEGGKEEEEDEEE